MRSAKGGLRFLRGTTRLGVVYGGSEPLQGFVDTDWAGDIDSRRSTTGFVFTCNGGPIALESKRQSAVATSTAEAENVAAAIATKEALWLRLLLSALSAYGGAVLMKEENQSSQVLVDNPEATGRPKLVDFAYHKVRDYQARADVAFFFFPGADMPTDGLTKPQPSPALAAFPAAVGVNEDLGAVAWGAELGATSVDLAAGRCRPWTVALPFTCLEPAMGRGCAARRPGGRPVGTVLRRHGATGDV